MNALAGNGLWSQIAVVTLVGLCTTLVGWVAKRIGAKFDKMVDSIATKQYVDDTLRNQTNALVEELSKRFADAIQQEKFNSEVRTRLERMENMLLAKGVSR